jgi:predicted CoA-substrate-specific enzyme activase
MITAGVDLGETYVKAAILKDWELVGYGVAPTEYNHDLSSKTVLKKALLMAGLKKDDINFIVSTGYGRRDTSLTNDTISEITANAEGVRWLENEHDIHTIIDIGGQYTKVIALDDDFQVSKFEISDKYDVGTGRFLEVLAKVLDVPLDEIGPLSLRSKNPVHLTNNCLVLAESEVANLIFQGYKKEDIIAGINLVVAKRLATMVRRVGIKRNVLFDGGPALNIGIIKALEDELGTNMYVPKMPQIVTATGATLIAAERYVGNGNGNGGSKKIC